jgi:hypothetical protein
MSTIQYPDLDFQFMVFQSNPHKELLYYWVDGEKVKRTMRLEAFYAMVKAKQPELVGLMHEAAITYSFHLWSIPDHTITHLFPNMTEETEYPDSINNIIWDKKPHIVVKRESLEEVLNQYGFNLPTPDSVQNLQVSLKKYQPEEQGFLARFFNRGRSNVPNKMPKVLPKTK